MKKAFTIASILVLGALSMGCGSGPDTTAEQSASQSGSLPIQVYDGCNPHVADDYIGFSSVVTVNLSLSGKAYVNPSVGIGTGRTYTFGAQTGDTGTLSAQLDFYNYVGGVYDGTATCSLNVSNPLGHTYEVYAYANAPRWAFVCYWVQTS